MKQLTITVLTVLSWTTEATAISQITPKVPQETIEIISDSDVSAELKEEAISIKSVVLDWSSRECVVLY